MVDKVLTPEALLRKQEHRRGVRRQRRLKREKRMEKRVEQSNHELREFDFIIQGV